MSEPFEREVPAGIARTATDVNFMNDIFTEYERASRKFPPFNSAHEGIAVIEEEFLELRQEVFHGTLENARTEAIQTAAMCLRFLTDMENWVKKDKPKFTPGFVKFGVQDNLSSASSGILSRDIF